MLKFLMLGAFLWQEVVIGVYGQTHDQLVDTETPILPCNVPQTNENSKEFVIPNSDGKYNFYAKQQIFYFPGLLGRQSLTGLSSDSHEIGREIDADYVVTNGIGAHKLHTRKLSWNRARRVCVEEGGHLAVIRSDSEETNILQIMREKSVENAWVGYHDKFEEGDWLTVLDEPIAQTGWARWSQKFAPNPDNYLGKQHCAYLTHIGDGMDDFDCEEKFSFVCKISFV